jgi:hypothetical protein
MREKKKFLFFFEQIVFKHWCSMICFKNALLFKSL